MRAPKTRYRVPHYALRMIRERTIALPEESVSTPVQAARVAHALIGDRPVEHLIAILVDGRGRITGTTTLAQGGMHGTAVRVADVFRAILTSQASAFVLAHNHPSGDPEPSREDRDVTDRIREAGELLACVMLDHVVVVRSGDYRRVTT